MDGVRIDVAAQTEHLPHIIIGGGLAYRDSLSLPLFDISQGAGFSPSKNVCLERLEGFFALPRIFCKRSQKLSDTMTNNDTKAVNDSKTADFPSSIAA
jgi:hypothetical protein